MDSVNPNTGERIRSYERTSPNRVDEILAQAQTTFASWRLRSFAERARLMRAAGAQLRARKSELAELMADEMGKILKDGEAEIEKCASCCDFYAEKAEGFLRNEPIATEASSSYVAFDPLGPVLAVMPWNFPFWQVFRFAAPTLMAGNVGVLKHASNVSGCALAIEDIFAKAGFPKGALSTVLIPGDQVEALIANPAIKAVTLTGSGPAGASVAAAAGRALKKSVLELGGSDPYVVLEDANLELAVKACATSRLINAGQSCIAAKRFIVVKPLYAEFERRFVEAFRAVKHGPARDPASSMGPLARRDLRDAVHEQTKRSVAQGARLLCGGEVPPGPGAFYPATALGGVRPGMTAFDEEVFGPVAAIVEAEDERDAIRLANLSPFGLGAALFTEDRAKAARLAREIEAGSVFVNAFVKSDARLPFGGVKASGYGRELSGFGIREFVNAKTVSIV